ncbi:MAG: hypothetical protein AABY30_05440 [Candidatus Thermoplasmatota archaeon]
MTGEAEPLVFDVPEDWFARAEKALAELAERCEQKMHEVAVREQEVDRRTRELADRDQQLREREAAVIRALAEVEILREQQRAAMPASAPAAGPGAAETVHRLLRLEDAMGSSAERFHEREDRAQRLLEEAMERAEEIHRVEEEIRSRASALDGLRLEIVNAKHALEHVDAALARMPYEVVDDFTKTEAFDAYDHAVRVLRKFSEGSGP